MNTPNLSRNLLVYLDFLLVSISIFILAVAYSIIKYINFRTQLIKHDSIRPFIDEIEAIRKQCNAMALKLGFAAVAKK